MANGLARLHTEERSDECSWREMLLEHAVANVSSCSCKAWQRIPTGAEPGCGILIKAHP